MRGAREKTPTSLASNITITYLISFAVVLFAFGMFVLMCFRLIFTNIAESDIEGAMDFIADFRVSDAEKARDIAADKPIVITLYDSAKQEIFTVKSNANYLTVPFKDKLDKFYDVYLHGQNYRTYITKLTLEEDYYYLQVSRNLNTENNLFSILIIILIFGVILSLVVNSIIGYRVAHILLRPITQMTRTVKEISASNLSSRLDTKKARSELLELSVAINDMIYRLEMAYKNQKRFVSDASHELRTPLAIVKGYADMLSRWGKNDPEILSEAIDAIKSQTSAMNMLVEKLLFLTRADSNGVVVRHKHFRLDLLSTEILANLKIVNDNYEYRNLVPEGFVIYADEELIRQLFLILLDNAIKYTPSKGSITISAEKNEKSVRITISDTGIGMTKEHAEKVFERFYRVDPSRTKSMGGFGLGLSIAKEIVSVHGGEITMYSEIQKGTQVIVVLPG